MKTKKNNSSEKSKNRLIKLLDKVKKTISIYVTLFLLLTTNAVWSQAELNNYLITAAQNNPGLKAKFSDYKVVMERAPQVGALPDPVVGFGYFISPLETRVGPQQYKVSGSQMFPWFGTLGSEEDAVYELAKSKLELFEDEKSKLFFDVKSAYYNLYFIQKGILITQENIDILFTFKQLALIKFEAGQSSAVDELRVELEIFDLENELAYLQDSEYEMQVRFNNLLDVPDSDPVIIPQDLWVEEFAFSRTQLMDSIAVNNHIIQQIEHRILSWESQEVAAKRTGRPSFMVGVDYYGIGNSGNPAFDGNENGKDALMAKVGIAIPLYRKKYRGLIREASFEIEAAGLEKEDKVNQLSTLFELGYKDFRDGARRVILYETQLKIADQALDILLAEYSTDNENFEEVLRMERRVLKYELELDKAKADRNAAVAFVEYLMGK